VVRRGQRSRRVTIWQYGVFGTSCKSTKSTTNPDAKSDMGKAKEHCWECRRRRLVCDSQRPKCGRCSASGIPCPGYDGVKPARLRWLAPGRVISRNQPRKQIPPHDSDSNQMEASTEAAANSSNSMTGARISCLQHGTELCAFAEASEYCKYYPQAAYAPLLANRCAP